jgi:glycosyltransferase involved in cell wall biosynthesis
MTSSKIKYSIVITTFDRRFQSHLIPLLNDIHNQNIPPPNEVIVMINGPHRSNFNQEYRRQILTFLSDYENVYPTMFPNFQSLAKLWNRGILTAQHDMVLVLNDDLRLEPMFFESLEKEISSRSRTFRINGSFSHYMAFKPELIEVGFFDERLLGIGEEDGDFAWRYYKKFGREISSVNIPFVDNIQSDIADPGFSKGIRNYSKFNREFILNTKYKRSIFGHKSMFDYKVVQQVEDLPQYPYENFYRAHLKDL